MMWFAVHNVLAVDFDPRTDTFCLNESSAWRSAASITVQAIAQGAAVLEGRRHLGRPESGTPQRTACRAWSCCSQYRLLGTFAHRRPFSEDIGTRQDLASHLETWMRPLMKTISMRVVSSADETENPCRHIYNDYSHLHAGID